MVEQAGHQVSRTKQPRAHTGFGNPKNGCDLNAAQFLEGRKHQHLPLFSRQLVNAAQNVSVVLRRSGQLFGREPCRGKHSRQLGNVVGFRSRLGAALAIEHDVPDNADQPHPVIAHFTQRIAVAQDAHERLLHGILCISLVAKNGIGHAV